VDLSGRGQAKSSGETVEKLLGNLRKGVSKRPCEYLSKLTGQSHVLGGNKMTLVRVFEAAGMLEK